MNIPVVYKNERLMIIRTDHLFYPNYDKRYFILEKSEGYGFFIEIIRTYTKGEILDKYGIVIKDPN